MWLHGFDNDNYRKYGATIPAAGNRRGGVGNRLAGAYGGRGGWQYGQATGRGGANAAEGRGHVG